MVVAKLSATANLSRHSRTVRPATFIDAEGRRPTMGDEPRKLIAIRLDAKVLGWLRNTAEKKGLPYQSLVNEILASEMRMAS
jgi:uncharacterized protein (DUF4415 family)